jgi:release factor glutamine methyltransferase
LALNLPNARIFAIDISPAALKVAKHNCQKHHIEDRITLLTGDLLEPLSTSANIIVANLPYIRTGDLPQVNTTGYEPRLALDGGADGLDRIKQLSLQAKDKFLPGGCLLMEIGLGQNNSIASFLHNLLPSAKIDLALDLSGIKRVVCVTLPLN